MAVTVIARNNGLKAVTKQTAPGETIPAYIAIPEGDIAVPDSGLQAQDHQQLANNQFGSETLDLQNLDTALEPSVAINDQPIEVPDSGLSMTDASGTVLLAQAGIADFGAAIAEDLAGGAAAGGVGAGGALAGLGGVVIVAGGGGGATQGLTFPLSYERSCANHGEIELNGLKGNIAVNLTDGQYSYAGPSSGEDEDLELASNQFTISAESEGEEGYEITIAWKCDLGEDGYETLEIENLNKYNEYLKVEDTVFKLNWTGDTLTSISLA